MSVELQKQIADLTARITAFETQLKEIERLKKASPALAAVLAI